MSESNEETPSLKAWLEWNEKCTIEKCSPETSEVLASFGRSRFRLYAGKYCGKSPCAGISQYYSGDKHLRQRAWFELEMRLWRVRKKETHQGERKVYKNWLFERANSQENPLDCLQGYCTKLMRTAVRECCEIEGCSVKLAKKGVRLEPLYGRKKGADGDGEFELVDVLLLARDEGKLPEAEQAMEMMVKEAAQAVFAAASRRVKVALAAKYLEIPLYDPMVLLAAGCGKSVLSAASKSFEEELAEKVKADYEGSRSHDMFEFFKRLYRRLLFLADDWKNSEMGDDSPF